MRRAAQSLRALAKTGREPGKGAAAHEPHATRRARDHACSRERRRSLGPHVRAQPGVGRAPGARSLRARQADSRRKSRGQPYAYDALGNLKHITRGDGLLVDYVYDAFGRRIAKLGSLERRYLYRNGLSPVAVLDNQNHTLARFVFASRANSPDFMVLSDGSTYAFVSDQRGSPRLIVNTATGAIAQRIDYDEFGKPTITNSSGFDPSLQPFGFAGGLYDADTGLVRFGARDYEADTGRWLAKDPILFAGRQSNLYVYVNNDPVNHTDPSGHWGFAIGGSGGAGFGFPLGGSWDVGSGIVFAFDSTGITIAGYTANTVSLGAGAYLGFGFDGTVFKGDLANFAGTSYGGKLDVGVVEKGDFKISNVFTKAFAAVCGGLGASSTPSLTGSAGVGGGLYAGLTRTRTQVEGYNFTTGTLVSY
jgi:RHS repeat-associated protein